MVYMSREQLLYEANREPQGVLGEKGIEISQQSGDRVFSTSDSEDEKAAGACCFPQSHHEKTPLTFISYKNILWCESTSGGNAVNVTYVKPVGKTVKIKQQLINIVEAALFPDGSNKLGTNITEMILQKAYIHGMRSPSILVLVNPRGGTGTAVQIFAEQIAPILKAAHVDYTYIETERRRHAVDIARELDIDRYDIIACVSGDGIPHEVINGFYQRPDKGVAAFNKLAVTQLPGGSGNAFTLSTHGSNDAATATVAMLKGRKAKFDLMAMTMSSGTYLSFLSQCYGLIVQSDIGTEWMRWIGPKRFEIGTFYGVLTRAKYPCDVYVKYVCESNEHVFQHFREHHKKNCTESVRSIDDQKLPVVAPSALELKGPKLTDDVPQDWSQLPESLTDDLSIFYVGKMPYVSDNVQFFPAALPNDHAMDLLVMDTKATTMETVNILTQADKGTHIHSDKVIHSKVLSYRLVPQVRNPEDMVISVDGESFPMETFQVEVLPGILTVLLQDGNFVDTHLIES